MSELGNELYNNLREIQRDVEEIDIEGKKWYQLTVVQQFAEENVNNMIQAFQMQRDSLKEWIDSYDDNLERAKDHARQEIENLRERLLIDIAATNEEVLASWREEKKKKLKWLNDYALHRAEAIKQATQQFEALKKNCAADLAKTEEALKVWQNVKK